MSDAESRPCGWRFWRVVIPLAFVACQSLPSLSDFTVSAKVGVGGSIIGAQGPIQLACNQVVQPPTQQNVFVCPATLQPGDAYSVSVVAKPLGQQCQVAQGTGVITSAGDNVVVVTCTGERLPALSLDIFGLDPCATLTVNLNGTLRSFTQNGPITLVQDANVGATYTLSVPVQPPTLFCSAATDAPTVTDPPVPVAMVCIRSLRFAMGQSAGAILGHPSTPSSTNYSVPTRTNVPTPGGPMRMLYAPGDTTLLIADWVQNRIIGLDDFEDGAQANLVWGQNGSFTANAAGDMPTQFDTPTSIRGDGDYAVITHFNAHVVEIRPIDGTQEMLTSSWVGTAHQSGCSTTTLNNPRSAYLVNGLLYVADSYNNRVAVWRQSDLHPDGAEMFLVIGQSAFDTCADGGPSATLSTPWDVWSDGNQLVVADTQNHRVLIYDPLPTTVSNPAPSYVIGQPDLDSNSVPPSGCGRGAMVGPVSLTGNGRSLFVTDYTLNRVVIFDAIPSANQALPIMVVGQADFDHCAANASRSDVNDAGFSGPWGSTVDDKHLFVCDSGDNRRVLMFTSN